MTGVTSFEIFVDKKGPYIGGQVVSGVVRLITSEDVKARSIYICYQGKAFSCFGGGDPRYRHQNRMNLDKQRSTLFAHEYNPANLEQVSPGHVNSAPIVNPNGCLSHQNAPTLPAGTYNFRFAFTVRQNAPPSLELSLHSLEEAYIRYTLTAVIERPWLMDITVSNTIQVNPHVLSFPPVLYDSIKYGTRPTQMSSCCCLPWFNIGEVSLKMKLFRQIYAPRDRIEFLLKLQNTTSAVLHIEYQLVCTVHQQSVLCDNSYALRYSLHSDTVDPGEVCRATSEPRTQRTSANTTTAVAPTDVMTHSVRSVTSVSPVTLHTTTATHDSTPPHTTTNHTTYPTTTHTTANTAAHTTSAHDYPAARCNVLITIPKKMSPTYHGMGVRREPVKCTYNLVIVITAPGFCGSKQYVQMPIVISAAPTLAPGVPLSIPRHIAVSNT